MGFLTLSLVLGLAAVDHSSPVFQVRGDIPNVPNTVDNGLPCDSKIFCYGELMHAVHTTTPKLFPDTKNYVDRPLKYNATFVLQKFDELKQSNMSTNNTPTADQLREFLNTYFDETDEDLPPFTPLDWRDINVGGLPLFKNITDDTLKLFAKVLHDKWGDLGRKMTDHVQSHPDQHSLTYVPYPFVVPGGRFDEIYYWDSLWVIQGLLASNMTSTARDMINNFVYLIKQYGYIPNGNRVYYRKRSQPPVLALVVDTYIKHPNTPASDILPVLRDVLPALETEFVFWSTKRNVTVTVNGTDYKLNIHRGNMTSPRPESYREDYETAMHAKRDGFNDSLTIYRHIAAGAESGWDFSTRWLEKPSSPFYTIRTESIVPVDLNAFLCAQENLMSEFYTKLGNTAQATLYHELALNRGDALHAVLWNAEKGNWRDFDLVTGKSRLYAHLSDSTPVYTKCKGRKNSVTSPEFLQKLLQTEDMKFFTKFPGGAPMSTITSNTSCCQWDYPNAWPPNQLILIEGFAAQPSTRSAALTWAQTWVTAVLNGFLETGSLYEKYNAEKSGAYGAGGEYAVQLGFGWTNGGVLRLLEMFPSELTSHSTAGPTTTPKPSSGSAKLVAKLTAIFMACTVFFNL